MNNRLQLLLNSDRTFVEIDHEIFSTVILSLPLIQEGQLSVSGERLCTILVNRFSEGRQNNFNIVTSPIENRLRICAKVLRYV